MAEQTFQESIIEEFRANGGVVTRPYPDSTLVLVTMQGARSGRRMTLPLEYLELDGVLHGTPERGIGEDLFIEAQAHELARSARSDLVERVHDGLRQRQDEDGAEEQQGGEDEQESRSLPAIQVVLWERDA